MGHFDGQVVWITGGGTGIGRATAVEFARQGAKVAVSGRRVDRLADAVANIQQAGGEALAVGCDVTDEQGCRDAVQEIVDAWGRLDVAMANAGFAMMDWMTKLEPSDYRRQIETDVFGVSNTVYAALPEPEQTKGQIVLVGSVASYIAPKKFSAYCASKAAVRALSECWDVDLQRQGVGSTIVCPGYVSSEISQVNNQGVHNPEAAKTSTPLLVPAPKAAKEIVAAVRRKKRVAGITGHGRVLIWVKRHLPWLSRMIMQRM